MAVPRYDLFYDPILKILSDGEPHASSEIREKLRSELNLDPDDLAAMLPSGRAKLFNNRVGWATTYLRQAKVIEGLGRGVQRITERGINLISGNKKPITNEVLLSFPEFQEFLGKGRGLAESDASEKRSASTLAGDLQEPPQVRNASLGTPDEDIERGVERQRAALVAELLNSLHGVTPEFFERVVIDTLVAMGYGGSFADAAQAVGRSGDGGIDGVIQEDRLGLESIYVQAKRWRSTVGRPDVQGFVGSLVGVRARKGVFITTSSFSQDAREYVRTIEHKVVLIDGRQLASLMVEYDVGVSTARVLKLKQIDSDYFDLDSSEGGSSTG